MKHVSYFGLCGWLVVLGVLPLSVVAGDVVTGKPVVRARPSALKVAITHDTVSLREFAGRFGLSLTVVEDKKRVRLQRAGVQLDVAADCPYLEFNGVRFFLGEAVTLRGEDFRLGALDETRILGPLLALPKGATVPALRTIVLDAGHGGKDMGTQNSRLKLDEKELTLDVVKRLEVLLTAKGYHVVLTRDSDRFVELLDRTEVVCTTRADLFVSVHFNAADPSVSGTETMVMPLVQHASNPYVAWDVPMIGLKMPANAFDEWNVVLGYELHRTLIAKLKTTDRGVKRTRFSVLRMAECPAVLVESAFISNDADARKVATPAYRQQIAEALDAGIASYAQALAKRRSGTTLP